METARACQGRGSLGAVSMASIVGNWGGLVVLTEKLIKNGCGGWQERHEWRHRVE